MINKKLTRYICLKIVEYGIISKGDQPSKDLKRDISILYGKLSLKHKLRLVSFYESNYHIGEYLVKISNKSIKNSWLLNNCLYTLAQTQGSPASIESRIKQYLLFLFLHEEYVGDRILSMVKVMDKCKITRNYNTRFICEDTLFIRNKLIICTLLNNLGIEYSLFK